MNNDKDIQKIVVETTEETIANVESAEENTPTKLDRHKDKEPESGIEEYNILNNENTDPKVVLPTELNSVLKKLLVIIENMSTETFKEKYSKKQMAVTGVNLESQTLANDKDIGNEILASDDWVNEVNYSDKTICIDKIPVKGTGKLTGTAAIAKFSSALAVGEYITIPLYHSGFNITIKPPYDDDIVNLDLALSNNEIKLGRSTSTLVYSNYSVVYTRILTDFIISHLVSTTLDVPNDVNIADMISVNDFYPMLIGMLAAMNPKGYTFIKSCVNTVKLEDEVPICNYSVTGTVNPMLLLRVNKKDLTQSMLEQMSKKQPNSVTIDNVKEYQLSLSKLKEKVITIGNSDTDIKLTLKVPTLGGYIDNGEAWVDNIISKTEAMFTEADKPEQKNVKIRNTLNAVILGVYNIYISRIELITDSDRSYADERADIDNLLDMFSVDDSLLNPYIQEVRDYITNSKIAIVATSKYICPNCKKEQPGGSGAFKEFIPLNALEHFFDLSALRLEKIQNRTIS